MLQNSWQQVTKNNKSVQEEYKIWVLVAQAYGYVVQFRPYQGTKKGKQVAPILGTDSVIKVK